MRRISIPSLFVCLLVTTSWGCNATTASPSTQSSAWGPASRGLQARFDAPAEAEQNSILNVSFELQSVLSSLPADTRYFDTHLAATHVRLTLSDPATGKTFSVDPYDPSFGGPPIPNSGKEVALLDGSPLKPIAVEFPLRSAGGALKPGEYSCSVSYASNRGRLDYSNGEMPKGIWVGEVRTPSHRIIIKPEVSRTQTLLVPARLRLTSEQQVVFLPEDAERVTVTIGNGMFIGTRITSGDRWESLQGEVPEPNGPNPIDDWNYSHPPGGNAEYTIEVFATGDRPHHLWGPGPGANGYKTLWERQFVVRKDSSKK